MEITSASDFGWLARQLSITARSAGLSAPGFRSPPKVAGKTRTVRRYPGGNALVSVQTKGRSREVIVEDMVEGVVVANCLSGNIAVAARRTLLRGLAADETRSAA